MTLASKIAKASKQVGGALKADARNMEQKYNYISADKVLTVCGQALAEQGIALFPSVIAEVCDVTERGNGKYRFDAAVTFHMHVADDDGEIVLPWVGRGSDYSVPDKALYKALTSGHKYFLMKLLNIGEGNEDGEHDATNVDMAGIPEDTAGRLATSVQNGNGNGNGHKPQPKATASSNMADAKTVKLINAMGEAAFYGDWKKKHDELCSNLGISSTNEMSADDAQRTIARLRDNLAKNLSAGMQTIYGDAEDAKADFIETVTEWTDKNGNKRAGVKTLGEATDWNLVFLTSELHKLAKNDASRPTA